MKKNTRCRWAATAGAAILAAGGVAAAVMPRAHAASKAPVVEILLENTDYSSVVGDTTDAPYINKTLIPSGTLYTNYYAVSHPSLPNYLALVTGDTCGKDGTDNVTPLCSETTVFNQLSSAGIPAGEYAENESADCSYAPDNVNDSDGNSMYAERHDPYGSDSAAEGISPCGDHTLGTGTASPGVGSLVTALKSSRPPQFAFVTPNLCDNAHDCSLSSADSWLSANVPSLLNAGADVIVTFDESLTDSTNGGGKVMTVQVGPGVTAGARDSTLYTHYSLLAGVEKYFGLPLLSNAASATPLPVGGSSSSPSPSPSSSSPSPSPSPSSSSPSPAVLDNETFEDGGTGSWQDWYGETISNTTAQAHSGTHSLEISNGGQSWGDWGIQQGWPGSAEVTPGVATTFSGWLKCASGSDDSIVVTVSWLDANANQVGSTQVIDASDTSAGWTEFSGTFTPPAGAATAWETIEGSNGGTHYLDDFKVTNSGLFS